MNISLILVFFLYGLAFFVIGIAVALESRHASALALGRQLRWLAAFGFTHSLVEWSDMFMLMQPAAPIGDVLTLAHVILLPVSTVLLVRFGIGLIQDAGPSLPIWLTFVPAILLVPAGLLIAFALSVILTEDPMAADIDLWSRYLLYFPGCVLTGFGFIFQAQALRGVGLNEGRKYLVAAAVAFFVNAFVAGLVVPPADHWLSPWLNSDLILTVTGLPVQVWRMTLAIAVTYFVLRALGVFKAERDQQLRAIEQERERTQASLLASQIQTNETAQKWIRALVQINERIATLQNVDEVLVEIVKSARALLKADSATLGLWDPARENLLLKAYALADRVESGMSVPIEMPLIKHAAGLENGAHSPIVPDLEVTDWYCPVMKTKVQAAAIVPLWMDRASLGAMWITRLEKRPFDQLELDGLTRLAFQAVIAIEHALMAERLQSLATIEERARIAREMHDGLAQILGFLSLQMQTLEAFTRQGNHAAVLDELKNARERIGEAQFEVRDNILSLRTTLGDSLGLVPALKQYLSEFGVQSNIAVECISNVEQVALSPLQAIQLVRIVHEALTNIRKHAKTQHACVQLTRPNGCLEVVISDDGVGFDPHVTRNQFGLQSMRERAESIGGQLQIIAEPGRGTQILVQVPLLEH